MKNLFINMLRLAVLISVSTVSPAMATEKAHFMLKVGTKPAAEVAEALLHVSLQNCLQFESQVFDHNRIVAGIECSEWKDIFVALEDISAKLDGIEGITTVNVLGK